MTVPNPLREIELNMYWGQLSEIYVLPITAKRAWNPNKRNTRTSLTWSTLERNQAHKLRTCTEGPLPEFDVDRRPHFHENYPRIRRKKRHISSGKSADHQKWKGVVKIIYITRKAN
jgi:hypothetical protein